MFMRDVGERPVAVDEPSVLSKVTNGFHKRVEDMERRIEESKPIPADKKVMHTCPSCNAKEIAYDYVRLACGNCDVEMYKSEDKSELSAIKDPTKDHDMSNFKNTKGNEWCNSCHAWHTPECKPSPAVALTGYIGENCKKCKGKDFYCLDCQAEISRKHFEDKPSKDEPKNWTPCAICGILTNEYYCQPCFERVHKTEPLHLDGLAMEVKPSDTIQISRKIAQHYMDKDGSESFEALFNEIRKALEGEVEW
jgi:hypothetical protein